MNGAESLVNTLADQGVEVCFANPGTSEMHFLAALENPRMKSVLCLFEGVATGAADGWYRMRDTPASTLLHLGPGLANGLANIHNAKRASSGMVNIIGEHATAHLKYDAPLTSDIEGLARPLSHWVRRADSSASIAQDTASAVAKASEHPGQIATLILPGDTSWGDAGQPPKTARAAIQRKAPDQARVDHVAQVLRAGEPTLIIFGGKAMRGRALDLAGRVAAKTGARLATQFFSARIERGAGRVPLERIPYAVLQAVAFLKGFKNIVTVETGEPIAFFSYPDKPSLLKSPEAVVHSLATTDEDSVRGLEMLLDALGGPAVAPRVQARVDNGVPTGKLEPISIAHALASAMPEHCILVDESLTTGRESMGLTAGALPHDTIQNMGGSIGYGTPVATGAALACPDRRVFCMVGDGSAMYTIQSLWTQAREGLNVTTIIFANHSYQILKTEFANMGFGAPGPQALAMIDIDKPRIDWVAMGTSMGVPSHRVTTAEDFHKSMVNSVREAGPVLIEVAL
ncbi:acetolactate synthase large subunit [Caulobacter sp. UNC358MFTsu5.1]|uniref:acetolactate synthase large subunit n=1 Tax=Caulobacter sp. UNC358MFTsu5.1 TaxID=1449049 RepID=UPI0004A77ECB|nr:acetolactate synthase large subunit [Caulobacter sp. UNC358MFTsu5.1]